MYVPSHWWHEVETSYEPLSSSSSSRSSSSSTGSSDSNSGYSVGLNYFFEPYYHRLGYQSKVPTFQHNRYYAHLHDRYGSSNDNDWGNVEEGGVTSSSKRLKVDETKESIMHLDSNYGATVCSSEHVCFRNKRRLKRAASAGGRALATKGKKKRKSKSLQKKQRKLQESGVNSETVHGRNRKRMDGQETTRKRKRNRHMKKTDRRKTTSATSGKYNGKLNPNNEQLDGKRSVKKRKRQQQREQMSSQERNEELSWLKEL